MDFDTLKEHVLNLPKTEFDKFSAWKNAGHVKRRWFAFIAGVIVGAVLVLAFGCSESPRQTGPNSACFPGPKVVD